MRDYRDGRFGEFDAYMTSAGIELTSIEQAFEFNRVHEGMHLGYAMALLHVV